MLPAIAIKGMATRSETITMAVPWWRAAAGRSLLEALLDLLGEALHELVLVGGTELPPRLERGSGLVSRHQLLGHRAYPSPI